MNQHSQPSHNAMCNADMGPAITSMDRSIASDYAANVLVAKGQAPESISVLCMTSPIHRLGYSLQIEAGAVSADIAVIVVVRYRIVHEDIHHLEGQLNTVMEFRSLWPELRHFQGKALSGEPDTAEWSHCRLDTAAEV